MIYYEGDYFMYEGGRDNSTEILHQINKLVNPIVTLTTDEQIQSFLAFENEFIEDSGSFLSTKPVSLGPVYYNRKTKTRVLIFAFDTEDF